MAQLVNAAFTGTDGTNIRTGYTTAPTNTPGGQFGDAHFDSAGSNSFYIDTNRARSFYGDFKPLYKECSLASGIISVDILLPASGWFGGLVFRYVDPSNYFFCWLQSDDGKMYLYKRESGGNTDLGSSVASGVAGGNTYTMTATLNGNSILLACNGATISKTNSTFNTSTLHGFVDHNPDGSTQMRFNNFVFDDGSSGGNRRRRVLVCGGVA